MNISICITVKNEEGSIGKLLDSLLNQTKKADEIIVVDGGSTDGTVEIIKHYQKKNGRIKLLREKCSRARGRNLAVEVARNEIIAMTDAGCIAKPDWLEKIGRPFNYKNVDVAAGFYEMTYRNSFQKAARRFLGVLPGDFGPDFLPSTRSAAFRKAVWEEVGGFDEDQIGAAEDTVFNYKLLKQNKRISRVKDAVVEWGIPQTIYDVGHKMYEYAKGDVRSKVWLFPRKSLPADWWGLASHNIKAILVFLRYGLGLCLLVLGFKFFVLALLLYILVTLYLFRAFRKAGFWGIPLQITADFAVMLGFINGLF